MNQQLPDNLADGLLYIRLPQYQGPLALLLELVSQKKLDIYKFKLADICTPYFEYLQRMRDFDLEIASEFLSIAATLAFIKSAALLPKPVAETQELKEELEAEAELHQQLIEYHEIHSLKDQLVKLNDFQNSTFARPKIYIEAPQPRLDYKDLIIIYQKAMHKQQTRQPYTLPPQPFLPLKEQLLELEEILENKGLFQFQEWALKTQNLPRIIARFLAILELTKAEKTWLEQHFPFAEIYCHLKNFNAPLSNTP